MYFAKAGWQVDVPAGYKIADTLSGDPDWDRPVKDPQGFRIFPHNCLFSVVDDRHNFLTAFWIPYEQKKDGQWSAFVDKSNMKIYSILNFPGMQLDTISREGDVSDQKFQEFIIIRKERGKVESKSIMLNRQFGERCLRIYITAYDDRAEERILAILQNSRFVKSN